MMNKSQEIEKWEIDDAQKDLKKVIDASSQTPQLIYEHGKPLGAIIDILLFRELMTLRKRQSVPSIAELLDELSKIQIDDPIDLEITPREDRDNPLI